MHNNHLCLFADWETVVLQNFHQSQFNHHRSKPHPHAIPWPNPKGQEGVWLDLLLVLLTESVKTVTCIWRNASCVLKIYEILQCALWQLPVRVEHLWLWPQLRVTVQGVDWNRNDHALWNCDSIDLDAFFGRAFQTCRGGIEPFDKNIFNMLVVE